MFGQWSFIIAAIAVEGVRGLYLDGSARSFNLSGRALAALLLLDGWERWLGEPSKLQKKLGFRSNQGTREEDCLLRNILDYVETV